MLHVEVCSLAPTVQQKQEAKLIGDQKITNIL